MQVENIPISLQNNFLLPIMKLCVGILVEIVCGEWTFMSQIIGKKFQVFFESKCTEICTHSKIL